MARTFYCWGEGESEYAIGYHKWTVEDSPLPDDSDWLRCPDHDNLPNNDGPVQSKEA